MFLRLGFKSVTMDDIAAEMGMSKKTIYQHFANKEELVEAVTKDMFENISRGIDEIRDMHKNPIEEIFTIRDFIKNNLKDEATSPFYQLQKFFPKIFTQLRGMQFNKMHTCMEENLHKGVKDGLYRPEINIEFISRIYFTGLVGVKDTDIFPPSLFTMQELTQQFLEYHLRGIVTITGLKVLTALLANDVVKIKKI